MRHSESRDTPQAAEPAAAARARSIVGALTIRPGAMPSIACERPMVGLALMRRLIDSRPAAQLPDAIASLFTLCADVQRQTAKRALQAAFGEVSGDALPDPLALTVSTAREHLQRFAIELPLLVPREGVAIDAAWVRDAPVFRLPPQPDLLALAQAAGALPAWLEQQVLGMTSERWLAGWQRDGGGWLADWAGRRMHPMACWLNAVRDEARSVALACRALDVLDDMPGSMRLLAASLGGVPGFAAQPLWHGAPAETGAWTRHGRSESVHTLWDRLGARVADLLRVSDGEKLACGALAIAPGEGIAWSEMARGLLVHWARLEPGARLHDRARAERYQVLAPTEWNFHPDGALAQSLSDGRIGAGTARLATAVLDPCVNFSIATEAGHA